MRSLVGPARPTLARRATRAGSPKDLGRLGLDADNMIVQVQGGPTPEAPEALQPPQRVSVSPGHLAKLRSSLPSPNKFKGKQLAERMGVSTSGGWAQNKLPCAMRARLCGR